MFRYLVIALLVFASPAQAQQSSEEILRALPPGELAALLERVRTPTPDEQAFARLPQDVQLALRGMPLREALQKVRLAEQNLIALGTPSASPERLRGMVEAVLAPRYTAVLSSSAGATSFPPLSPLVPAVEFEAR
jgi:hypothetical protein